MIHQIEHHPESSCFTLQADGGEARLDYRLLDAEADKPASSVDFTYTYVPPEMRGQGLAEALARHGLAWAREQDYHIQASCWYVAKFLR